MTSYLGVAAGVYLLVLGFLFVVQRHLLYVPSQERPDLAEFGLAGVMEPVRLTSADGTATTSWFSQGREADSPVIVLFHGNAGHIGHRGIKVRPYLDAGYGVLLQGYRGYGGNPGRPTEEGLYADARAALEYLSREGIRDGRIVLYGESLGSAVAVQMATERSVAAVVLEAPFTSIADLAQSRYPIFPVRWLVLDRYDSLSKIDRVRAPVFFVHGERDRIVPVRFGRRLFGAANEPKEALWLPEAEHNDLESFAIADAVLDFVRRRVPAR
jgi:hypothetical protein